ncbi:MAG: DnaB-like helicase C-terminal domain-containing protein [Atribacterota bacterium]
MIELQIINKILNDKSLSFIRKNNITADYFTAYRKEFDFIEQHFEEYGNIPDKTTFIDKFEDFDIVEITESERFLIEELKEQYLFNEFVPFIQKTAELAEEDSRNAINYVRDEIDKLSKISTTYLEGTDLVKNAKERFDEFKKRKEMEGLLGISTGINELDEILYGWLPEDFCTIIARTNEGKTWLLLYFLVQAWKQGKKVLLYNGELPNTVLGFRFDTIYKHFSNYQLSRGSKSLNQDNYKKYITYLSKDDIPFIVVKPRDIGGRLTVKKLENLIEKHEPDIIGIDQLTLMEDYRGNKGQPDYKKYEHIAEDLYLTAENYGVPILAPHQASRKAIRSTKEEDKNIPELQDIYGSDAIAHSSKRVITFKKVDKLLKLAVKKNTYGENNKEITMIWDIDAGIVKPVLKTEEDKETGEQKTEQINQEGVDLF